MRKAIVSAAVICGLASGCGGYPAPVDQVAKSEAALRAAQEIGARNDPKASLHLKLAQEELQQARNLMKDGENKRAEYVLMRAQSDAELSLSLAKESTARNEAQQVVEQASKLKQRLQP